MLPSLVSQVRSNAKLCETCKTGDAVWVRVTKSRSVHDVELSPAVDWEYSCMACRTLEVLGGDANQMYFIGVDENAPAV